MRRRGLVAGGRGMGVGWGVVRVVGGNVGVEGATFHRRCF